MSENFAAAIENTTKQISNALPFLHQCVAKMRQDLQDARLRVKMLEEELEATKPLAAGVISRNQFENYFLSARKRKPTDLEWNIFLTSFTFPVESIAEQVYRWIETIQPFIDLEVGLHAATATATASDTQAPKPN